MNQTLDLIYLHTSSKLDSAFYNIRKMIDAAQLSPKRKKHVDDAYDIIHTMIMQNEMRFFELGIEDAKLEDD